MDDVRGFVERNLAEIAEWVVVVDRIVTVIASPFVPGFAVDPRPHVASFVVAVIGCVEAAAYDAAAPPFRSGEFASGLYLLRILQKASILERKWWSLRRRLVAGNLDEVDASGGGEDECFFELFVSGNDVGGRVSSHFVRYFPAIHMRPDARPVDATRSPAAFSLVEDGSAEKEVPEA